ncbi:MAG TPA: InlB B-repeat-containing protein, partial [Clostridia bacterium]|nr:InlB B-repeat-containing protein [Clostridia bacterium]
IDKAREKIEDIFVPAGRPIYEPDPPQAKGFVFEGWYADPKFETRWDFTQKVTASMTLYGKWIPVEQG